jgi:3-mercaptopyruvate sulfurtransferase SseA
VRTRLILVVAWALAACGLAAPRASAQEMDLSKAPRITVAELKQLRAENRVVVVDVRDADSFKAAHIPGALSIPLDQLDAKAPELKAQNKVIVTYCA